MHVLLINPAISYFYRSNLLKRQEKRRYRLSMFPGLTLPHIAAIIEEKCDGATASILDEGVEEIHMPKLERRFSPADTLVGITAQSLQIVRAFEIADLFRAKGYKVMMGGIHVSLAPEGEAKAHCDVVVVGEAEEIIPRVIKDFKNGNLKNEYKSDSFPDLTRLPRPRFELLPLDKYFDLSLPVQTTRGCVHDCDFCSVRRFNGTPRVRPIDDVIAEIRGHFENDRIRRHFKPGKPAKIFFTDDHFCVNPDRTIALCEELTRLQEKMNLKLRWSTQVTPYASDNKPLIEAMARSGCSYLLVGFETLSPERLKSCHKVQNKAERYLEQIKNFQSVGIGVVAAWIVGFEDESMEERDRTLRFFRDEACAELAAINPLTPFVGTRLWERLRQENKLREPHYWLSEDVATRLFPLNYVDPCSLAREYWRINAGFYNLSHLAKVLRRKRNHIGWDYINIFMHMGLNARWIRGAMFS